MHNDKAYAILGWNLDMIRAARERPWWARQLVRIGLGRYAYRELIGLQAALAQGDWSPEFSYELEHMDYHQEKIPCDFCKGELITKGE